MTDVTDSAPRTRRPAALPVYLTAAALARTADEGARVALVMLAAQRAGSPALGGALVAALMVPHVAAAPVAGALADAVRRRRLFHGGGVALYGVALAALAALVGRTGDLLVLALAAAAGCVAPLLTGGLTSLLGELLPKDRLTRAFSADAVSYNLAGICGPAAAAALGTATSAGLALAVLGAGATAGGLLLFSLRLRPRSNARARGARPRPADLLSGAAVLVRDRPLRSVTWASSLGQLGVGALPVVSVLLADRYDARLGDGRPDDRVRGGRPGRLAGLRRPSRGPGTAGAGGPCRPCGYGLPARGRAVVGARPGGHGSVRRRRILYRPPVQRAAGQPRTLRARGRPHQVFTLGAGLKSTFAAAGAAAAGALSGLGAAPLVLGTAVCQVAAAAVARVLLTARHTRGTRRAPAARDTPVGAARQLEESKASVADSAGLRRPLLGPGALVRTGRRVPISLVQVRARQLCVG
jgi:MFS family permease